MELAVLQMRTIEGDCFFSDLNDRLIKQWLAVQESAEEVYEDLLLCEDEGDFPGEVTALNSGNQSPGALIWLLCKSHSALYRERADGNFNAPRSKDGGRPLPSFERLQAVSDLIRLCYFRQGDWSSCVRATGSGDLVFCDPPYLQTYGGYTASRWSEAESLWLVLEMQRLARSGATCLMTETTKVLPLLRRSGVHFEHSEHPKARKCNGASKEAHTEVIVKFFY